MAKESTKLFWRGLGLVITGMLVNTAGNYLYANRAAIKTFALNLQKQLPDIRDLKISDLFNFTDENTTPLPATIDLRPKCPPVYDQKSLSACTSNAGVAARIMLSDLKVNLSRLFLYYYERDLEGAVMMDTGATMRDVGKALQKYGVCEETYCPYVESKYYVTPSSQAITNAEKYKISNYYSLSNLNDIRQTLNLAQKPVIGLFELYDNFSDVGSDGVVAMPSGKFNGNHAQLICGYSDAGKYLIVRNSWGVGWGDKGYAYFPYDYVSQGHAQDFWYLSG